MARVRMSLDEIRAEAKEHGIDDVDNLGIMALVDVEDMGWCKDGVTRYYLFVNDKGQDAIYYQYQ